MNHSGEAIPCSFAFADHMLDAAAIYSLLDRRLRYLNSAAEQIFGVERAVLLAGTEAFQSLIVEDDRPGVAAFLAQTALEGSASGEFCIRRPDGQLRWLAARSFAFDETGDKALRAVLAVDITPRKGMEQALSESEIRFHQIAENVDEVLWIASADFTQIQYVSPAYARVWGRGPEELYSGPFKWLQPIHPDDQAQVLDAIAHFQSGRLQAPQFRLFRDGEWHHIRQRWVPVRDAGGQVTQVVCMSEDVSEQKLYEAEAEQSARAQREALVREVHHRIKNNLQGVTGMLRNFANQHVEVAAPLNEAIAQVQAVAVIYGLQGRPGAGRVVLEDLLKEIIAGVGQLMHSGLNFSGEAAGLGYATIVNDAEAVPVALVLNEMVFNAIKHGVPGTCPHIDMRVDIARECVSLTVTNAGCLPRCEPRQNAGGGSGLQLIRSLLPPRGAHFDLIDGPDGVQARLILQPPIVTLQC